MKTVMISLISEQAMPNVLGPLLVERKPDIIRCILPTDSRERSRSDSRFVSVYRGVQAALGQLGFEKVYSCRPVPPYDFEQVKAKCRKIRGEYPGATYIYNVTGGTKLMAHAALADATDARRQGETAWAVYVDTQNARLVKLEGEEVTSDEKYDPQCLKGVDVPRYFRSYGVTTKGGTAEPPPAPWMAAAQAVAKTRGGLALMKSLAALPEPSSMGARSEEELDVSGLEVAQREALEQMADAAKKAGVRVHNDCMIWPVDAVSKDFIWRRRWLELYVFDCVRKAAEEDAAWNRPLRNVEVEWPGWDRVLSHSNELDITAVRSGRLLICECKAGKDAPTADHIYKLQVIGYKAGTFADKLLVTATPYLMSPDRTTKHEQVVRALTLGILPVGGDRLSELPYYVRDFEDWLYNQQSEFDLRGR